MVTEVHPANRVVVADLLQAKVVLVYPVTSLVAVEAHLAIVVVVVLKLMHV